MECWSVFKLLVGFLPFLLQLLFGGGGTASIAPAIAPALGGMELEEPAVPIPAAVQPSRLLYCWKQFSSVFANIQIQSDCKSIAEVWAYPAAWLFPREI